MKNKKTIIISAIVLVGLAVSAFMIYQNRKVFQLKDPIQVEINSEFKLTNYIEKIKGYEESDLKYDAKDIDTSRLGTYNLDYQLKDKNYSTSVEVVDTKAPVVKGKDLQVALGTKIKESDFIESIEDDTKTTSSFKEEYNFDNAGKQSITIEVKDQGNNITSITQQLEIIQDTEAPTLDKLTTITAYTASNINYKKGVVIKDNLDKKPTYTVDSSNVNKYVAGEYTAYYTTKDQSGNTKKYERNIVIKTKVVPTNINATGDKVVYLTFDDGPSANTVKILNILDTYNAKATFFVTGNGQAYNKYIQLAYSKGNTIGLHTYKHNYAMYSSVDSYMADLNQIGSMVEGLIGFRPHYIRFPGGSSNQVSKKYATGIMTTLVNEVSAQGYRYYDWNAESGDAAATTVATSTIISNATRYSSNNIMLLFHDSNTKTTTVEALPTIIEYYQARGYVFKGIDDNSFTPHHHVAN